MFGPGRFGDILTVAFLLFLASALGTKPAVPILYPSGGNH